MPRHILIKLTKIKHKERILKAAREKQQTTYRGKPIWLAADISAEILQARREWQDIFKILKGKNLQPGLFYSARIPFKIDGRNQKLFRQVKDNHQTSFTTTVKGTYTVKKYKRRKRSTKSNPKQWRKWQCVSVLVTQSCPTLCEPMDCGSPCSSTPDLSQKAKKRSPCSSVHGILQARILEWVAIS